MATNLEGAEYVMLVGAYPPTVQERVWTNLQEEYKSWKGVGFRSFCEDGPRVAIYRVCQCIETRKTTKKDMQNVDDQLERRQKWRGASSSRPSVTRRESPQWKWLQRCMLTGPLSAELWGRLLFGHKCLFSTFLSLQCNPQCACAQNWCHFSYFHQL